MRVAMLSMKRARLVGVAALLALAAFPGAVAAQRGAPPPPQGERDSLEARVRVRMGQMLRNQLGLTDVQVRQLQATNRRFEGQRRTLLQQEREVRTGLRRAIEDGDSSRVSTLLDQMFALQRQRLDLTEAEQKELATFLNPVQRAKLFGMEEQIRRRMVEMQADRMEQRGERSPRRPPPH